MTLNLEDSKMPLDPEQNAGQESIRGQPGPQRALGLDKFKPGFSRRLPTDSVTLDRAILPQLAQSTDIIYLP